MPRKHNHQHRAAHRHYAKTDATLYVSITRAATIAKVSRTTMYEWIRLKKVEVEHIAGRQVIVKSSLGAASPDLRNGQ